MRGYRCETCGRTFKSETGFTEHRVGRFEEGHTTGKGKRQRYRVIKASTRRCLTAEELTAKGYWPNGDLVWSHQYTQKVA